MQYCALFSFRLLNLQFRDHIDALHNQKNIFIEISHRILELDASIFIKE